MNSILEVDKNQWTEVAIKVILGDENLKILPFTLSHNEGWIEIDNLDDLVSAEKSFSNMNQKSKLRKDLFLI